MANKTLNASVKLDTRSAEASLRRLENRILAVNKAIKGKGKNNDLEEATRKALIQQEKLNKAVLQTKLTEEKLTTQKHKTALAAQKVKNTTDKVKEATDKSAKAADKLSNSFRTAQSHGSGLVRILRSLAATYLGIMGVKAVLGTSDTITSAENRLNNLPGGNQQLTQEAMDKTYAASMRSRSGYTDMLSNVSKSMTLAGDAFQGNIDNAIKFQELMSMAYSVGGASAAEQSSSMYQMIQALGSGVLQGDELRSVREGAPLAYKAIEEFAQGVYNTEESLKELASQGKITSKMVVAAVMAMEDGIDNINSKFKKTRMTFAQAWVKIKNMAVKAFEPVSRMLNDMLNRLADAGAFETLEDIFVGTAKALMVVFKVIENSIIWIADNWDWLKNILIAGLIAYGSYLIITTSIAIEQAALRIAAWMMEYGAIFLILSGILMLTYVFYLWKTAAISTCEAIAYAVLALGLIVIGVLVAIGTIASGGALLVALAIVAAIFLALLYFEYAAGIVLWLVAIIIDVILSIVNVLAFVGNLVTAIVRWAIVVIINLVIGLINGILQLVWALVDPIISIVEWILNVCQGGFDSFGGAVANLIGQIIGWFLTLGEVVTTIIDSIFGTDWTSGLESLKNSVTEWGKNDEAITLTREAPEIKRLDATDAFTEGMNTLEYISLINPNDWFKIGKEWGSGVKDSVNEWGSQFQNWEGFSLFDTIGNALGVDFSQLDTGLPNPNDPAFQLDGAYNPEDLLANLEDIDSNVGDIKDSMDLSNDDLEYLRKIAEMEWRNEFTTAEIKIDMTNNNTVNGDRDLDGIVDYLSDVLRSEMTNVAYGVHY